MVESKLVELVVAGSSPVGHPNFLHQHYCQANQTGHIQFMLPAPSHRPRGMRTLFESFQLGIPVVFVTGQHKIPADSIRGDKLLEQRRRKLDVLSGPATNHHRPGRPAIIVQILISREAEVKFVSFHGISVFYSSANNNPRNSNPRPK